MAITIQQQPSANSYYGVGNPIEFLFSSTNSAAANFKLDVKLYYDPSGTNELIYQGKCDVYPSTTQVLFDAAPILRSKILEDITNLRTSATGVKNETTRLQYFNLKVQEYAGTIPALTGSVSTSNTIKFTNGGLKYISWAKGDWTDYIIDSGAGANQLTQRLLTAFNNVIEVTNAAVLAAPTTYIKGNIRKVTAAQLLQIMWLWQGTSGTNKKVVINTFSSSFVSVISANKSLASNTAPSSLNIGTASLIAGGGALSALDSNSVYMAVSVENNTYQLTGTYLYEIDWSPCSRFDSFEIHWLNRLGGWDSFNFDKRSLHTTNIERKEYNPTSTPISGSTIVHNTYDITGKNYAVVTKETYRLTSRYLREWELQGLEDLLTSPLVYWNDSGFVNIVIVNPQIHEHKKNTVDKLFTMTFEFEIDNQDVRQ
jgi:hypothetical protein